MATPHSSLATSPHVERVELAGHIIDSLLLPKVLDFIKPHYTFNFGLSSIQLTCLAGLVYYYRSIIHPKKLFARRNELILRPVAEQAVLEDPNTKKNNIHRTAR